MPPKKKPLDAPVAEKKKPGRKKKTVIPAKSKKVKNINIVQPYVYYAGTPPPSLDKCKIIGLDPARRNPGINVEIRTGEIVETVLLQCQDLNELSTIPLIGATYNYTYLTVSRYLESIFHLISDARILFTEKQPRKIGRANVSEDALRVGQHVISWIMIHIPNICIIEVDSRMRRELLDVKLPKGHKQVELKDLMIEESYRLAMVRKDTKAIEFFGTYLKIIEEQKKQGKKIRRPFRCHDMADTKIIVEIGLRCIGLAKKV
jgi:hypothetical protein